MVNVSLSNCFINQNIVATYYAVEVQIHAFVTAAIFRVVPIGFYFPRLLTCRENHRGALNSRLGVTTRTDGLDRRMVCFPIMGTETYSTSP
jgi:hypothetical protein